MADATHTQGPWLCSGTSVSNPQANRPNAIICDVSGWGNRDEAEQIANATLIAAAPDLLAALEAVIEDLEGGIEQADEEGASQDWLEGAKNRLDAAKAALAKAALAKAKGG